MKESKYYKRKMQQSKNNKVNYGMLMSKLLISIIVVLGTLIITNFNSDIKTKYVNNFLEHNISFNSINKVYQKYIGNFKPSDINNKDGSVNVSNVSNDIGEFPKKEVNGSYEIEVGLDYPVTFMSSGIIVFVGKKGDLENTVIVQGNDGVDIWYSNIINSDYSLYDYVSKGDILGTTNTDILVLSILKDGKKLDYDEYF